MSILVCARTCTICVKNGIPHSTRITKETHTINIILFVVHTIHVIFAEFYKLYILRRNAIALQKRKRIRIRIESVLYVSFEKFFSIFTYLILALIIHSTARLTRIRLAYNPNRGRIECTSPLRISTH